MIDGIYEIIPISHFGYSIEDLGLKPYDVLCWDPRMYVNDNCKIIIQDTVECTVKVMDSKNHNPCLRYLTFGPSMTFIEMLNILRSISMYPFLICSDEVADVLGLDEDGDKRYIKEVCYENKDSGY